MNSLDKTEEKVKFIVFMFKHYQPNLTIPEQIALLTLWEASCVLKEEYEMAGALIEELKKVQQNPLVVPQKNTLNIRLDDIIKDPIDIINKKDEYIKKTKKPFYFKIFKWVRGWFKKNV